MTAIAIAFQSSSSEFTIAADGRRAFMEDSEIHVATDNDQKIFPFNNEVATGAYTLSGVCEIDSIKFSSAFAQSLDRLAGSRSTNGSQYAYKVCRDVAKRIGDAMTTPFDGLLFRAILVGFFKREAFFSQGNFHFPKSGARIEVDLFHHSLANSRFFHLGASEIIGRMVYDPNVSIDARLAAFKNDPSTPSALEGTANFIRACSHPAAREIDPCCAMVGGHLHAAHLTRTKFEWLIAPLPQPTSASH